MSFLKQPIYRNIKYVSNRLNLYISDLAKTIFDFGNRISCVFKTKNLKLNCQIFLSYVF